MISAGAISKLISQGDEKMLEVFEEAFERYFDSLHTTLFLDWDIRQRERRVQAKKQLALMVRDILHEVTAVMNKPRSEMEGQVALDSRWTEVQ